jgi:hypothetical protein
LSATLAIKEPQAGIVRKTSTAPATTGVLGASGSLRFMTSLNAQNIQDLEGPEAVAGGSIKALGDFGFDFGIAGGDDSKTPNNPNNTKRIPEKLIDTETVSVGVGGVVTPYELPVEFHGGGGYSASSYSANLTSNVTGMANAARSGAQSAYQSAISLIQQEIIVIQQEISHILNSSNSNNGTKSK